MARTRGLGSPRVRVLVAALVSISTFASPVAPASPPRPNSLRLPTFLGSNAVLQRAPARAAVWGWAAPGALVTVELTKEPAEDGGVESDDPSAIGNAIGANDARRIRPPRAVLATARTSASAGTGEWIVRLPPQPASHGPFTLRILARSGDDDAGSDVAVESAVVADLAFGDVWLCAGQSNMQFTVAASFDAAAHIAESATVGDGIRIATVAMTAADVERNDVAAATAGDAAYEKSAWAKAKPNAFNPPATPDPTAPYGGWSDMGWFSAACWFHGLELYERSFKEVPVGLIVAAWGGQAIEPFSSKEALADETCGGTRGPSGTPGFGPGVNARRRETSSIVRPEERPGEPYRRIADTHPDEESPPVFPVFGPSALWNGMIAPLLNTRLKGVAWYQGEANWATPESYACRFPAMIADWRARFASPRMPFVFVQLAAYPKRDYSHLRGAQTFLTSTMEAVAYAVAADLGDPLSPWDCVHPRRKREVGRRLALAARGIERGGRIRGPEFIPEAPALLKGDVATGADKGSIRATFRLTRGADSPLASLVWAGTAGCDLTGTARCCGEAPFEIALDPPPPPRFDPPAVGAMLGVPDTSRATAKGTAMLGVLKGGASILKGDSVLRKATARDARIACARLGPDICAGFVALWNTLEKGPMPDDVVLDAVHLVPRPEPGRIAAEWNPDVSWTSVAFRGSDDPWVRATAFEASDLGLNGLNGSNGFNGDESGWIATAELADASLVSAETVVRGARYAWERYPQCMLYDGDPEGEERGVAAAPFCFDLARNAPCAPTNPRNP